MNFGWRFEPSQQRRPIVSAIRIDDVVENRGFRPTPHAILCHVNFGYPFLDESIQIGGGVSAEQAEAFNAEDKSPRDDFVDYFQEMPTLPDTGSVAIELRNPNLLGGVRVRLTFSPNELPTFGVRRAFQSGVYTFALEPTRRFDPSGTGRESLALGPGDVARCDLNIDLAHT